MKIENDKPQLMVPKHMKENKSLISILISFENI